MKQSWWLCYWWSVGAEETLFLRPRRVQCDARRALLQQGQHVSGRKLTSMRWRPTASWVREQQRWCWQLPGETASSGSIQVLQKQKSYIESGQLKWLIRTSVSSSKQMPELFLNWALHACLHVLPNSKFVTIPKFANTVKKEYQQYRYMVTSNTTNLRVCQCYVGHCPLTWGMFHITCRDLTLFTSLGDRFVITLAHSSSTKKVHTDTRLPPGNTYATSPITLIVPNKWGWNAIFDSSKMSFLQENHKCVNSSLDYFSVAFGLRKRGKK